MSEGFSHDSGRIRGGKEYVEGRNATNVVSYEFGRFRQLLPRMINRVMAFSSMTRFDDALVGAVREFYGLEVDVATAETDILEDEVERLRFYPWFLWDFRSTTGGPTIGDQFITESDCTDHERRLLLALCKSYVSFYEALEDASTHGALVRDLATGETIHIADEALAGDLFKGHIIQTRLVRIEGDEGPVVLVDAVYACLPSDACTTVEAELQNLLETDTLGAVEQGIVTDYLKGTVAECIHFADHLLETLAQPPEALNEKDEPIALCRATLRGDDAMRVIATLEAETIEGFVSKGDGLWRIRSSAESVGFLYQLDANRLMLGANTLSRLEALENIIEERFEVSKPALRSVSDFNDAVRLWSEKGGGHPWLKGDQGIAYAVQLWLQFWIRNWADIPSPMLDGQTPREAMYEPHGRRRVENALERFEKLKFGGLEGELSINLDKIRGDLGLANV